MIMRTLMDLRNSRKFLSITWAQFQKIASQGSVGDGNTAVLDASSPNFKITGSSLQVDGWDSSLFTGDINFNDLDLILRGNAIFGINKNLIIVTGKQIGRASCRERVCLYV